MNPLVLSAPWLVVLLGTLAVSSLWLARKIDGERARREASVVVGLVLLGSSALALLLFRSGAARLVDPLHAPGSAPLLALEPLGALLLPTASLTALAVLLGAPRRELSPRLSSAVVASLLGSGLLFLSVDVVLFALGFCLGLVPAFVRGERERLHPLPLLSLGASAVLFLTALVLLVLGAPGGWSTSFEHLEASSAALPPFALPFFLIAVLLRSGVFPFHSWTPVVAERQGAPILALLLAPQAGAYVLLRLGLTLFPEQTASAVPWMARIALFGAVYGALLGLGAQDLRRAFGWLLVSQSSLVLVGLEATNTEGLAGALFSWFGGALALTGLAVALGSVEARLGAVDLRRHYGLGARAPWLGGLFLLLGLSAVGLPGTIGFVAEDLLVHGVLESFPGLGISIVLATAANGYLVLKSYFRVFGGPTVSSSWVTDLLSRERVILVGLVVVLFGFGLWPQLLTRTQGPALEHLIQLREPTSGGAHTAAPPLAPKL